MDKTNHQEKKLQENYVWHRTSKGKENFLFYNKVLAYYKAQSILELVKGGSLLDIACGDGYLTKMIGVKFKHIVGIDASGSHLKIAKKNVPSGIFYESLIEDFEIDEKFDCITMIDLLEHLRDPRAILRKVATFLKPNGVIIVHVPNADAINRKLAVLMGTLKSCTELSPYDIKVGGHRRTYTQETLKKDVMAAGFKIKQIGGVFYKMLSTAQMNWFLENGLWEKGGFGWGRVGGKKKDWRAEFCRASYELGKKRPEDCNIIYACATLR